MQKKNLTIHGEDIRFKYFGNILFRLLNGRLPRCGDDGFYAILHQWLVELVIKIRIAAQV